MRAIPFYEDREICRILSGQQTQTRRHVNRVRLGDRVVETRDGLIVRDNAYPISRLCPWGRPGEQVWVKEPHSIEFQVEHDQRPPHADDRPVLTSDERGWLQAHYRATDPPPDLSCERSNCRQCRDHDMGPHWKSPIAMPRWAARILLEVTDVRVERLGAISANDAMAEGVCSTGAGRYWIAAFESGYVPRSTPALAYRDRWATRYGAGAWRPDLLVWVIQFRRLLPVRDRVEPEGVIWTRTTTTGAVHAH